jgi:hypothetical protein
VVDEAEDPTYRILGKSFPQNAVGNAQNLKIDDWE